MSLLSEEEEEEGRWVERGSWRVRAEWEVENWI